MALERDPADVQHVGHVERRERLDADDVGRVAHDDAELPDAGLPDEQRAALPRQLRAPSRQGHVGRRPRVLQREGEY